MGPQSLAHAPDGAQPAQDRTSARSPRRVPPGVCTAVEPCPNAEVIQARNGQRQAQDWLGRRTGREKRAVPERAVGCDQQAAGTIGHGAPYTLWAPGGPQYSMSSPMCDLT